MLDLSLDEWLHAGAFFAVSLLIIVAGKLVREALYLLRGVRIGYRIVQEDNAALGLELSAYILALVVGLLGSIHVASEALPSQLADLAITGAVVIVWLLVNDELTARLLLRKIGVHQEIAEKGNLAVAIPRAASMMATALMLRAALGHDSPFHERMIWVGIGQVLMLVLGLLYQAITPYDDLDQLRRRNIAAALPMAGIALAAGLLVEAALQGEGHGWVADLSEVGLDLLVGLVLLLVLRWLADLLLLPGAKFSKEIAVDRNIGAGLIEATAYVAGAWVVAYFIG